MMIPFARKLVLCCLVAAPAAGFAQDTQDDSEPDTAPEPAPVSAVRRLSDPGEDEYSLDLDMPRSPEQAATQGPASLPDPEQDALLRQLLARLGARPGDPQAMSELDTLLGAVVSDANDCLDRGDFEQAEQLLGAVRAVNPRQAGLREAVERLGEQRQVTEWLAAAAAARAEGRLVEPPGDSALSHYRRVLELDPANRAARRGLLDIQRGLIAEAIDAARNLDFEGAEARLTEASAVREPQDLVDEARVTVSEYRDRKAAEIEQSILRAIGEGDFDFAEFTLIDLIALGGYEERVSALRERLRRERIYGQYTPGQVVQDRLLVADGFAPAVVVIAAGSFLMGSSEDDRAGEDNERPRHRVTLARGFGLGMQEVTVAQFRTFVELTGYQTAAEAQGRSRVWDDSMGRLAERAGVNWRHDFQGQPAAGSLPVLHLTWNDAQAYVRWLSQATGETYRLPSEAEFEYALRADTATQYWWGDSRPTDPVENLTGDEDSSDSGREWSSSFRNYGDGHWGPAPGATFAANPFGVYDMAGNVSEWVADCWHANYVRAPVDGSAWDNPGCESRVVRGGNWASAPKQARSAARLYGAHELRGPIVGFRIAREL